MKKHNIIQKTLEAFGHRLSADDKRALKRAIRSIHTPKRVPIVERVTGRRA